MNHKNIVFHSDPGHGWIEIGISELRELGIHKKISSFSYRKGNTAYLEEDCDAGLYIKAIMDKGFTYSFIEKEDNGYSFIRNLDTYRG